MTQELFDVWFFYPDGTHTKERSCIPAIEAVKFAIQATQRPAARLGILTKIMITDPGDCCNWCWEFGKGVTFSGKEENDA